MLVFIDESGDAGFKIGSSEHLVIAMVIFEGYEEADKTRKIIKETMVRIKQKPEFKFSKCSQTNRMHFFTAINNCCFSVRYICLGKKIIWSDHLRKNPIQFYNYALKSLISHTKLKNAKIRIDGNGKKELSKALITYLRGYSEIGAIDKLKMVDSCKEELIQLADMVAGALARPYNSPDKKDANTWKSMIEAKIDKDKGEWIFK